MTDCYTKLRMEFAVLQELLKDGIFKERINGILAVLKEAIDNKDGQLILYCLENTLKWYADNIESITENYFMYCESDYLDNYDKLTEIYHEIKENGFSFDEQSETQKASNPPVLFLSHSSKNRTYADALERFITGLGVKKEQLIYTSHPLHKIPLDENIYEYLRRNIDRNIFMIFLWSDDYLESPACMNELGAAWLAKCDYTNMFVPHFSFENPKYHMCAVDTRKMGAVLNGDKHCKQSMLEFKDKIVKLFNLPVDDRDVTYLLDNFIDEIKELQK